MVSSGGGDSSSSGVVGLHPRGCQTWGPVLVLALVLVVLYVDWRTSAAEAIAIKLLDRQHMVHAASGQNSPGLPSQLQQRVAAANASRSSSSIEVHADSDDAEEDISLTDTTAKQANGTVSAAAAASPPALPPCNTTQAAVPAPPSPSPAPPAFARVVPDTSAFTDPVLPAVAKAVLKLDKQQQGRRVIAFSLFGQEPRYVEGALANALLARHFWPGWTMRIYYGDGVPEQILSILRAFGVELIRVTDAQERASSTLWRYYAATDPTVSRFIVRDIDARLSHRDKAAVDEWVDSGLLFHTMHDHLAHSIPIMGGLWGAVGGLINPAFMQAAIRNASGQAWGIDQDWLGIKLFPHVQNYTIDHSSYNCGDFHVADNRGFPTKREDDHDLVGNVHAPPDYRGITHNGPCPERCRRDVSWTVC